MKRWIKLQILESESEILKMIDFYFRLIYNILHKSTGYILGLGIDNISYFEYILKQYKKIKKGK